MDEAAFLLFSQEIHFQPQDSEHDNIRNIVKKKMLCKKGYNDFDPTSWCIKLSHMINGGPSPLCPMN